METSGDQFEPDPVARPDGLAPLPTSQAKPPLVRSEYAGASRAIGDLARHGMMTPAEAALARVRAFWNAESNAAAAQGIDLHQQAEDHWDDIRPIN